MTLEKYIKENSGLDARRDYIGMSAVGNCPRKIAELYYNGVNTDFKAHLNAYRGYRIEKIAKEMLVGAGIMEPGIERELIDFDGLVKGHTDGESVKGELIEIKSKNKERFDQILATNRLPYRDYMQVQTYMHYGKYKQAIVFVICPETFDTHTIRINPDTKAQETALATLTRVVDCIKQKTYPACSCGRCNTQPQRQ